MSATQQLKRCLKMKIKLNVTSEVGRLSNTIMAVVGDNVGDKLDMEIDLLACSSLNALTGCVMLWEVLDAVGVKLVVKSVLSVEGNDWVCALHGVYLAVVSMYSDVAADIIEHRKCRKCKAVKKIKWLKST